MQEVLTKLGVDFDVGRSLVFFTLVWTRVLMMGTVVPFLFAKPVPRRVTVAVSMALSFFIYPHAIPPASVSFQPDMLLIVVLFLKEAFVGLIIGAAVAVFFHAFSGVGQMVDNQRGMSIARVLIPQLGEQASIAGIFLFQFGIVIYLGIGGHLKFLEAFYKSYFILPILSFPVVEPGVPQLADFFMQITGEVIEITIQMAMPVIIAIFLADIILGIANRIAPQINVWMLGFQLKGYLGILMLFLSLIFVAEQMRYYGLSSTNQAKTAINLMVQKKAEVKEADEIDGNEQLETPEVLTVPSSKK